MPKYYSQTDITLRNILGVIIDRIENQTKNIDHPTNFIIAHVAKRALEDRIPVSLFFKVIRKQKRTIPAIHIFDPVPPTSRQLELLPFPEALKMYYQYINHIQAYIIKHPEKEFFLSDNVYIQYQIIFQWFAYYSEKLRHNLEPASKALKSFSLKKITT